MWVQIVVDGLEGLKRTPFEIEGDLRQGVREKYQKAKQSGFGEEDIECLEGVFKSLNDLGSARIKKIKDTKEEENIDAASRTAAQ